MLRKPDPKTSKAVSPLISTAIVIMISIVSIGIVLTIGMPAIQRSQESAVFNEGMQNMRNLDNLIREVSSESVGSLRTMLLKVNDGRYSVREKSNSVDFEHTMTSNLLNPGTFVKEGNILITSGGGAVAVEDDIDGDGATEIVLENEIMRVLIQKVGSSTSYAAIDTANSIKLLNMKYNGANITVEDSSVIIDGNETSSYGNGYTQIVNPGKGLAKAEALVHVNSSSVVYDVVYSLYSGADFLVVNTVNSYYK